MDSWDEYGEVEDYWEASPDLIDQLVARYPNVAPVRDMLVAGSPEDLETLAADIHRRLSQSAADKPKAGPQTNTEPDHNSVVAEFLQDNAKGERPRHVSRHSTGEFLDALFLSQQRAAEAAAEVIEEEPPPSVADALKAKDFFGYLAARRAENNT